MRGWRWNSFGGSILFAAVAGAGLLVAITVLGPILGVSSVVSGYAVGAAILYAIGIASNRRDRAAAGALASVLGMLLLLLPIGAHATVAGAAAIVATCRSGLLYRSRPLRAILLESALLVAGLGLAQLAMGRGVASLALAAWGYFLVQSLFFLVGGVTSRPPSTEDADPFDRARSRLQELLD
jgi:hypothetical protein